MCHRGGSLRLSAHQSKLRHFFEVAAADFAGDCDFVLPLKLKIELADQAVEREMPQVWAISSALMNLG